MFKDIEYSDAKTCNEINTVSSQNNKNPYEMNPCNNGYYYSTTEGCIVCDDIDNKDPGSEIQCSGPGDSIFVVPGETCATDFYVHHGDSDRCTNCVSDNICSEPFKTFCDTYETDDFIGCELCPPGYENNAGECTACPVCDEPQIITARGVVPDNYEVITNVPGETMQ